MLCVAGLLYVMLLCYELHLILCYIYEVKMSEEFDLKCHVLCTLSLSTGHSFFTDMESAQDLIVLFLVHVDYYKSPSSLSQTSGEF